MGDVPAWTLVLNTIATGGFSLAGVYLVPRGQREARRSENQRADAAIMREKAALIFEEIARVQAVSAEAPVTTMREQVTGQSSELKPIDLAPDRLSTVRSLIAVYFPSVISILDEYDISLQDAIEPVKTQFATALKTGSGSSAAMLTSIRFGVEMAIWQKQLELCNKLRAAMITAVRAYAP